MSDTITADPVRKLAETITPEQLEAATRTLSLPEAMRLGASVTTQAFDWGHGDQVCILTAGRIGAQVAGYCE
ncbi:hypothetical protein [Umezawaea sp. NPDC059074]|uniref:hypothetical protein n=1 Tax=Umezawaea sp. NPDC059074 TaxID=3346716 RepID=UPI0036948BE1